MAKISHAVWGLIVTTALHIAGIRGGTLSLYHKVGEDVRLQCNNVAYPNCSSTTWLYNRDGSKSIEEVCHGKVKGASERAERLILGSDCSLTVHDVRAEDAGRYTCQQFLKKGRRQHGEDAQVYLSVLTMTDLDPDRPVKLSCSLSSYDGFAGCNALRTLSWVWADEAVLELQEDPRYQVIIKSYCDITLTMTLRKEDNNRKLRCQLTSTARKVKTINTFLDFPISFPVQSDSTISTPITAVCGVLGAALLLLCFLAVIIIVRKKRRNQILTRDNIVLTTGNVTNTTGNQPNTAASTDNKDEPDDIITYVSINHSSQQKTAPKADRDDFVTYTSVNTSSARGQQPEGDPADPSNLNASVNKPSRQ